jgi:tetratricopeptide (TPR) repeat protein
VQLAAASAYLAQGRGDLAKRAAQDVLDHIQQSPVRNYFQVLEADALLRVGEAERRAGDTQDALAHLERALTLRETNDDRNSPWLAEIQIALADCLIDAKQYGRARSLITRAKAIHAAHPLLGEHLRRPLRDVDARLARRV